MEVKIGEVLRVDEEGFICFTGKDCLKAIRHSAQGKGPAVLSKLINGLGELSATAQKLKAVITNTIKFYHTDQRIYIKVSGSKTLGFVKVGERNLFFHDSVGVATNRSARSGNSARQPSSTSTSTSPANAQASAKKSSRSS